jgi:hypothetical protein
MDVDDDEDDEENASSDEQDAEPQTLVVTLHYGKNKPAGVEDEAPTHDSTKPAVVLNGVSNPPIVAATSTPVLPVADPNASVPFTAPTPPYTAPGEVLKPVEPEIAQMQSGIPQAQTEPSQAQTEIPQMQTEPVPQTQPQPQASLHNTAGWQ